MNWNDCLLEYSKEHPECIVYGSDYQSGTNDSLSMIVSTEQGPILLQQEVRSYGRGTSVKECAMLKIRLNTSYELIVKKQNLIKKGWDLISPTYIHFNQTDFKKKYAVRSNHPEYTKLALGELEWMQFMLKQNRLSVCVCPVEKKGIDHTIIVYHSDEFYDELLATKKEEDTIIWNMVECCKVTYWALSRFKIEDEEIELV